MQLLVAPERVAICGRFRAVRTHAHAAPAVVIGIDGPLRFVGSRSGDGQAVLVAPGFAHSVDTRGGRLAMFVLPPFVQGTAVDPVRELANPAAWIELARSMALGELDLFEPIDDRLAREHLAARPLDERIQQVLAVITGHLDENLPVEQLADEVRLSPSRLMVLAREQLGTPLRTYRRWLRSFRVARDFSRGHSLTQAAIAAGFASSAHLSSATREHFGICPSDVLTPARRTAIRTLAG